MQVRASAAPHHRASSQTAAEQADEQVQIAIIQLDEAPEACKEVLRKMLSNILRQPEDPKFRKVRLANPRIKETIVEVEGALELLQVYQTLQVVEPVYDPCYTVERPAPFTHDCLCFLKS